MGKVIQKSGNKDKKPSVLKVGNVGYKLPDEKSIPVEDLGGYVTLIYGAKKIGKTSLCAMFKNALFLFFEPGGKALRIFQEPMTSWKKFTRFVQLLKKDKRFDTVVIDTADLCFDKCEEETCLLLGIDTLADADWGKGWSTNKKEFVQQINTLVNSGKGVIFISHQKEVETEDREGNEVVRKTNTLGRQAREVLEGIVDIWANYDYIGNNRILTILGNQELDAGHRLKERFRYTDGSKIRRIEMGNSEAEAYENFLSAFNNKLEKPKKAKEVILKKKSKLLKKKK